MRKTIVGVKVVSPFRSNLKLPMIPARTRAEPADAGSPRTDRRYRRKPRSRRATPRRPARRRRDRRRRDARAVERRCRSRRPATGSLWVGSPGSADVHPSAAVPGRLGRRPRMSLHPSDPMIASSANVARRPATSPPHSGQGSRRGKRRRGFPWKRARRAHRSRSGPLLHGPVPGDVQTDLELRPPECHGDVEPVFLTVVEDGDPPGPDRLARTRRPPGVVRREVPYEAPSAGRVIPAGLARLGACAGASGRRWSRSGRVTRRARD